MIKFPIDLKDNKPQALAFLTLIASIIFLLDIALILKPQITCLTDSLSKSGKMSADSKSARINIASIDKYKSDIASSKGKVDKYEKMLPAEQEIPSLLENLSEMAKEANIKILGITPVKLANLNQEKKAQNQIYQEIPILISAKSGYHELGAFLAKLENSDRFMKVVDIKIKSNKITPKKHDIELIVCTYILLKGKGQT